MKPHELSKLYPMLRVLSKLADDDRAVLAHYLTHPACDGIYECVRTSLVNNTVPKEDQKNLREHYLPKQPHLRRILRHPPKVSKKKDSEEKQQARAIRFANRRRNSIVKVADDLGPIFKTSLPLIKRYVKAQDSDDSDENNFDGKGEVGNNEDEDEEDVNDENRQLEERHSVKRPHRH